jgi:curved DNA-binding protein
MNYKDYYKIMGLERSASAADIKRAYRQLAHQYHPDISKDDKGKEKFQEVGEAYAVLKDPEKRKAYDELGQQPAGQPVRPPPNWGNQFDTGGGGFDDVDLADLFAAFGQGRQGGRGRAPQPRRGQDVEISVPVSLEQLYGAVQIEVRPELVEVDAQGHSRRVTRTYRVSLPKGATDGQRLRLAGKGGQGTHGGPPGDLYVALAFEPHALYRVNGRDLSMDLVLAPWEAVLGGPVRVPTLGGEVELQIKPGTQAGQQMRLAKRGLPGADGEHGALYAVIVVAVPAKVSDAERALYEQLAAISSFKPRRRGATGD